ncbi:MAG: flagellar hook basal-body protein [Bryobacteraceae bacterium]|nr:flagellar hook basal-body protein [Bryobacteraceae bacterium]
MDPLTITAASGLRSRIEALDLLANNMANSSTAGYKAGRESYNTFLTEAARQAAALGLAPAQPLSPVVENQWVDLSQGSLTMTGDPFDLAISGPGFLIADGPAGPLLTRGGPLQVGPDGRLTTREGYEIHTLEPRRIQADPLLPLQIGADGTVLQRDLPLGRLKIVGPPDSRTLVRRQGAYFPLDVDTLKQLAPAQAELRQGALESANLGPAEAAIRLVHVLRQFETLQKAMQIGGEMNRRAVEEIARVQS